MKSIYNADGRLSLVAQFTHFAMQFIHVCSEHGRSVDERKNNLCVCNSELHTECMNAMTTSALSAAGLSSHVSLFIPSLYISALKQSSFSNENCEKNAKFFSISTVLSTVVEWNSYFTCYSAVAAAAIVNWKHKNVAIGKRVYACHLGCLWSGLFVIFGSHIKQQDHAKIQLTIRKWR